MKKFLTCLPFILCLTFLKSEGQNLVPNPSFEDTVFHNGLCIGPMNWCINWFNPTATSPDFYTFNINGSCINSSLNNPSGYQLPRTGFSYVGIYTYAGPTREYVAISLDSFLSAGCTYYVQFYISQANNFGLGTDRMGCTFVNDTTGFFSQTQYLNLTPAIENPSGFILNDTLNWTSINGFYTAQGTEKYLLIGNFYDDLNTLIDTSHVASFYNSYYYVDDVYVSSCITSANSLNSSSFPIIYPNPSNGSIKIPNSFKEKIVSISVYNMMGIKLKEITVNSSHSIELGLHTSGLYITLLNFISGESSYYKIELIN
jgi:hypothetical protein